MRTRSRKRPIGEPVAQYRPSGGRPWPDDAPTHGREQARLARHVDGRVEEPAA